MGTAAILVSLLCAAPAAADAGVFQVELGQAVELAPGDRLELSGSTFSALYEGTFSKTPCATPTNCGSGYMPEPQFTVTGCAAQCPFIIRPTGPSGRSYQHAVVAVEGWADRRTTTLMSCKKLSAGVLRDACLSGLSMHDSQTDGSVCALISPKSPRARDICAARIGKRTNDDLLCRTIVDPEKHNRCLWDVVAKTRNLRACEAVIDGPNVFDPSKMSTRAGCTVGTLDTFLGGKAKPDVCKGLVEPVVKAYCLAWTASPATPISVCNGLTQEPARAHCLGRLR